MIFPEIDKQQERMYEGNIPLGKYLWDTSGSDGFQLTIGLRRVMIHEHYPHPACEQT